MFEEVNVGGSTKQVRSTHAPPLCRWALVPILTCLTLVIGACGTVADEDDAPTNSVNPRPISGYRVRIDTVDDLHAIIALSPAGSEFTFAAGIHRLERPIVPRDGDIFRGDNGATLSGARLLENAVLSGDYWTMTGQSQESWLHGSCQTDRPRCNFAQELFLDDHRLEHVGSLREVTSGSWYFDYESDTIYLADDPTGRRLETSVAEAAIAGDADNVTVRNLIVEKFANPAQRGAIMADRVGSAETYGREWLIVDNVVRWNHGVGIRAGAGAHILRNVVVANGQLGISSVRGRGTVIEGNEIAYNNAAGFSHGWEAGGTKFWQTELLEVRNNHSHHNDGPGLWTDGENSDTLYEGNVVEYNTSTGIFHEVSYAATIRENTVRFNGFGNLGNYSYVFGSGILVYNSSDVEVYGNTVVGNLNGINGLQHDRGSGTRGPHQLRNLFVHDNTIELRYHASVLGPQGEQGVFGVSGVSQAGGFSEVFSDEYGNRFDANCYLLEDEDGAYFATEDRQWTFADWQTLHLQDTSGWASVTWTHMLSSR